MRHSNQLLLQFADAQPMDTLLDTKVPPNTAEDVLEVTLSDVLRW